MIQYLEDFITKFFGLLRTHEIYPLDNETSVKSREEFLITLKNILKQEFSREIILEVYGNHFLVNNKLTKPGGSTVILFTRLLIRFKKLNIVRLKISDDLEMEELIAFLLIYIETIQNPGKKIDFKKINFNSIKLWSGELVDDYKEKTYLASLYNFIDVLCKILVFNRHIYEQIKEGIYVDFVNIRRVIQEFISSLIEMGDTSLGFISLGLNDENESTHSILRGIIGVRFALFLKFPLSLIEDLLFLLIFSTIGFERLEKEILHKKDIKEEEKELIMEELGAKSYEMLLKLNILTPSTALLINSAALILSKEKDKGSFFEILKIIRAYESLIQNKPYRLCYHPLKAMEILWKERNLKFEKDYLESFFSFLTKEPIGSTWTDKNNDILIVFEKRKYKKLIGNKWEWTKDKPLSPLPLYKIKINPVRAFII